MTEAGDIIAGRFRLEATLGEGGLGVVWRATELVSGVGVAIKLLKHNDRDARRRFAVEAEALRRLQHPGCVAIFEFGEVADGSPYLVTELLHGQSLDQRPTGPLPIPDVLRIANEIAAAVGYAHAQGVTHRDLKPANVFLTDGGLKVLDFGLAKLARDAGPALTATGIMYGTPHYISPEQVRDTRNAGPATDQYALGVVLFELLSGRLPFQGTSMLQICMAHLNEPPPRLLRNDCPERLRTIVFRLLEKEPQHRFPNFDAVASALAAVDVVPTADFATLRPRLQSLGEAGAAHTTRPYGRGREEAAGRRGVRVVMALSVILLVLIAAIIAIVVRGDSANQPRIVVPPSASTARTPPAKPPPPRMAPDVGAADAGSGSSLPTIERLDVRRSSGCGRRPRDRRIEFSVDAGHGPRKAWMQLPDDYAPDVAAGSVTLFTYRRRPAMEYAERAGILRPASRAGLVVIGLEPVDRDFKPPTTDVDFLKGWEDQAPPHLRPWEEPDDLEFVRLALARAGQKACLDLNRMVAVGHAEGASMLQRASCEEHFEFAALVLTGWALEPTGACAITRPVPTLRVFGADDPFVPLSGGRGCAGQRYLSAAHTDIAWSSALGCSESSVSSSWVVDERCTVLDCELGAYVACIVDGGHYLAFSHYNQQSATTIKNITTAFGSKPPSWFDPTSCPPTDVLALDFERTVLPFLQHYVGTVDSQGDRGQ